MMHKMTTEEVKKDLKTWIEWIQEECNTENIPLALEEAILYIHEYEKIKEGKESEINA